MKSDKLLVILIFSIALFAVGSVCACDNSTYDNLTQINDADDLTLDENINLANESKITNEINITFDHQMWQENLSDIQVQLPENATGTFCLKINDFEIYNQTITNKSISIPVKLPKPLFPYITENIYPPRDCTNYKVTAFYNDIELNLAHSTLSVMKFPPNYDYWWSVSSEVLQYNPSFWGAIQFPRSANGIAEIYVDDKLINKTKVIGPYLFYDSSEVVNLALGNHTMKIIYYNDSYYHDANKTLAFEVVNVKIDIPTNVYIGHNDCISVDVLKNTTGAVNVYIDNLLVCTGTTDKLGSYILSLEKYLNYNSSEVKIEFIGKEFSREKIVPINITYDFGYYAISSSFIYGENNIIELILPDHLNNGLLSIKANGTELNFTHPEYYGNNIVEIDISKLSAGNYTIVISYPGDAHYTNRTESYNINVVYDIICPYEIDFKDNSVAYLNLPSAANGNLTIYIDGSFYKTTEVVNGKASIKVNDLIPGEHNLTAIYTGDDFIVNDKIASITVNSKLTWDTFFTAGQDKSCIIEVPKDCEGYVIFKIDDKKYNITIKNGIAKCSFKDLKAGLHNLNITYHGENGFENEFNKILTIYKPKIKVVSSKVYTNAVDVKVKVLDNNGKTIKNAQVSFKINGKTIKAKTNSKGIATIKGNVKLQAKKYKITATYNGGKVTKTIKAKHVLSLKTVKVKKSAKKLVLTATLKQSKKAIKFKTVTFKFNGKTYKSKTNSKGIAKVTIKKSALKKLKVGKTVKYKATYLKDTVKKSVKIKK